MPVFKKRARGRYFNSAIFLTLNHSIGSRAEMKALILAGGFGTRLRPLSCTRPKLLFPVANRPMLDWTMESLSRHGINEVVLAVSYMADAFQRYFGNLKYGIKILYSFERIPLGTAGPLKKAEGLLGREPFLAMNGDVLSDISYSSLMGFHERSGALLTISLCEVEETSRFGVVEIDSENRILRFVEKPKPGEEPSKLINAGVYAIDPEIFDYIPEEVTFSLEREIFPKLSEERKLFGYRYSGLWVDIGEPEDYVRANNAMLERISKDKPIISESAEIAERTKIIPPIVIGDEVKIEEETRVGPYVSVGDGSVIKKRSRVERAVLFPRTWVDSSSSIRNALIGEGAIIGQWVKIENNVIIGDSAFISDNITLANDVTVCPSKNVDESIIGPRSLM